MAVMAQHTPSHFNPSLKSNTQPSARQKDSEVETGGKTREKRKVVTSYKTEDIAFRPLSSAEG